MVIFKKRRRHNYRRKKGHRQQHTILKILSIGGEGQQSGETTAAPAPKAEKVAPAPTIDETQVASSEGVVPADAGTEATTDVTNSTPEASPAKAKAKKTPKA